MLGQRREEWGGAIATHMLSMCQGCAFPGPGVSRKSRHVLRDPTPKENRVLVGESGNR